MHGPLLARCPWHADAQHHVVVDLHHIHILLGQQVDADLLAVMQVVPQRLAHPFNIRQTQGTEAAPWLFLHAQQNHPTIGIGHGAVAFPHIVWQLATAIAPLRCLAFQVVGFCQAGHIHFVHSVARIHAASLALRPRGFFTAPCAARSARMRSSSALAGSSWGSCGTSWPEKAARRMFWRWAVDCWRA